MVERKTLVKIAYWYYRQKLTQEQIAKRLNFSRQRVNKLVSLLEEQGVVTIAINGLEGEHIMLENFLERRFSLRQAIVVEPTPPCREPTEALCRKAAEFLDSYIQNGQSVGISWGATLGGVVRRMRQARRSGCQVVQLVGGINTSDHVIQPDEVTRILANRLGCNYHILYAPAIMSSEYAREMLAGEDAIIAAFERIGQCDIALVGVGEMRGDSTIVSHGYISQDEMCALQRAGYVGDICFNHFKIDGTFGKAPLRKQVMGVDIAGLKNIPCVVAIAGGEHKAEAVLGALNTGCIDILITDAAVASAVADATGAELPESIPVGI